ncbi:hypothetical protein [Polyangium fumosum]|uniref:Uncharacterized protein n=1 Tax=Polyangium fumosum TaxID=889272 RepID=A0A4U1JAQ0_9BACT|nr:hypothetical protein [Polyangium fumosum]TKD06384.1 hypothetical protein E8A74_19370 [Polyangium fumosum]
MVERTTPLFRNLVFDRNAIVRAALRADVESLLARVDPLERHRFAVTDCADWTGDLKRGTIYYDNGCGDYVVVAWTEVGVVGLALDGWQGPIEQLDLSVDAVTGGPDDVRGAVPDLPEELEPALVLATGMLDVGPDHGEKLAGAGFWLCGDRAGGTLFVADDLTLAWGVTRLAAWGLLRGGRLPRACSDEIHLEPDEPEAVPIQAIIDAVVDRRLKGPTELTTDELATLLPKPPDPKRLLAVQRSLQKVGITWPGSPKLPEEPRQRCRDTGVSGPMATTTVHPRDPENLYFYLDRDAIVRAALRAYIENTLAWLDPLDRHPFAASFVPHWTGDLSQGAFRNKDEGGSYEVMAWSEAGVVGLAYEFGYGPIEHLELPIDAVKGGPDDVRVALTDLPAELLPTLEIAAGLLDVGAHGEKLASVGVWLHGELVGGSLYEYYIQKGKDRLYAWGKLKEGKLRRWYQGSYVADLGRTKAAPIQALADALTDRALKGPTELLPDELATLLPKPPDPERWLDAQRMLQKVGITWPGSPEIPSAG